MESASDIIESLGGVTAVAAALSVPLGTASAWKTRDSIPPEYWETLVAEAVRRGIEGVTLDLLARIAARRRKAVA